MKSCKKELCKYLNDVAASPAQKSKEWYDIRRNTLGGSEISTVLGVNPYSTVQSLIAGKIGLSSFTGNTATRWGNLFEHLTQKWSELILQSPGEIKDVGSVKGIMDRQRYSPDGLGVIKLLNESNNYEYYIILFEFKAPLGTLPNKKIPKHYVPQIQTGMLSIPLAKYSIFVNNCYRKCQLNDLCFNGVYDKEFHQGDYKKRKFGLENEVPYACGVICFYQTVDDYFKLHDYLGCGNNSDDDNNYGDMFSNMDNIDNGGESTGTDDNYYGDYDMELLLETKDNMMDLGGASKFMVDRLFELHDTKRVKAMYYPIVANNERISELDFISSHGLEQFNKSKDPLKFAKRCISRFKDRCDNDEWVGVGYLPWKLMRSDVILELPDPDWYEKIKDPIIETLDLLERINNSKNPIDEYYNIYPQLVESEEYLHEMGSMNDFLSVDADTEIKEINVGSNTTDY
jgi:hypothetical protein